MKLLYFSEIWEKDFPNYSELNCKQHMKDQYYIEQPNLHKSMSKGFINNFSINDCNKIRTHNHLVRKRKLDQFS